MIRAALLLALFAALPAHAGGDAARGQEVFAANCRPCHMVAAPSGQILARGGRTGPNLWGAPNRPAGTAKGFRYSAALGTAAAEGLIWTPENFAAFIADPRGFLGAPSRMTYRYKGEAADLFAYLQGFADD